MKNKTNTADGRDRTVDFNELFKNFSARDRANNPGAWAAHDAIIEAAFSRRASTPPKSIVTNGKIYITCAECGKLVRANKPFIGSMHLCA